MMDRLSHLSRLAHQLALEGGTLTPHERPDLGHLPMLVDPDGVPVFDAHRMRDDQIEEAIEILERMVSNRKPVDLQTAILGYLRSVGRHGVRQVDVQNETGASKPTVLRALRRLEEEGRVIHREEETRGNGSRRKRYYWVDPDAVQLGAAEDDTPEIEGSVLILGTQGMADTGIRYHGTAVQAVTCSCLRCRAAFEDWVADEMTSAARRKGGNQLGPGVELKRLRREREDRRVRRMLEDLGFEEDLR
jgi:DNA-binding MarR family transcriptional regulator